MTKKDFKERLKERPPSNFSNMPRIVTSLYLHRGDCVKDADLRRSIFLKVDLSRKSRTIQGLTVVQFSLSTRSSYLISNYDW